MEKFTITREMIKSATDYMPSNDKRIIATSIAQSCLFNSESPARFSAGNAMLPLPPLKVEDAALKQSQLLAVLLTYYFGIEIKRDENGGVDVEDIEKYGASHIYNQIRRFKSDAELKDKCYDILDDFKDFEKVVNVEIANIKQAENNGIGRIAAAIAANATPEKLREAIDSLKDIKIADAEEIGKDSEEAKDE